MGLKHNPIKLANHELLLVIITDIHSSKSFINSRLRDSDKNLSDSNATAITSISKALSRVYFNPVRADIFMMHSSLMIPHCPTSSVNWQCDKLSHLDHGTVNQCPAGHLACRDHLTFMVWHPEQGFEYYPGKKYVSFKKKKSLKRQKEQVNEPYRTRLSGSPSRTSDVRCPAHLSACQGCSPRIITMS